MKEPGFWALVIGLLVVIMFMEGMSMAIAFWIYSTVITSFGG